MTDKSRVVHSDPEILSGTPVFVGTRVPVQSLFDYIDSGDTPDEFLRQFPSVQREQVISAIEFGREWMLSDRTDDDIYDRQQWAGERRKSRLANFRLGRPSMRAGA